MEEQTYQIFTACVCAKQSSVDFQRWLNSVKVTKNQTVLGKLLQPFKTYLAKDFSTFLRKESVCVCVFETGGELQYLS